MNDKNVIRMTINIATPNYIQFILETDINNNLVIKQIRFEDCE